jgi:competence protein ComEC
MPRIVLLVALALGWTAGTALQLRQPALAPGPVNAAFAAAGLLLALVALGQRARGRGALALLVASALWGHAATSQRAAWRLADALPAALEGQDLVVTGVIAELPRIGPAGARFVFDVEGATLRGEPVRVPERLSLGWFRAPDADALLLGPADALRAGQRWRLPVRLRRPHGQFNPHGFDLELWLFERGLRASGQVRARAEQPAVKLADNVGHPVERARQAVRDGIEGRLSEPGRRAAAGVLAALAVGDQAAIERDDWDVFRHTGVAHLMSISGLHVTMFAWLAGGLTGRLWRRSERLALALPAPTAAMWGGLAAAALYALFAGFGVPAQRTVWMIAVVVLLRSAGLRWPALLVLLVAGWVVVLADPWALLQPGFWLSFGAVGLLLVAEPAAAKARSAPASSPLAARPARLLRALREGLRSQAVATVGLAPLSLIFFQQLSLVGFFANLVAIPLVTLLITPLALLGVLLPPLWDAAGWSVQMLSAVLGAAAQLPGAVWHAAVAPPWAMAAALLGGALAVAPLPWRLRALALPLMLPLVLPAVPRLAEGHFELVAADVGQGTAVLVRTRGHLLVYDAGPAYTPEADAGSRVLVPLLRARGEHEIALLMLSHRDSDHVGGAASLMRALPVRALASSLDDDHPLLALQPGLPHRRCAAGQAWSWDGVRFEVLHPDAQEWQPSARPNALSCVLRVSGGDGGHRSALLTGDIEAAQEAALLARGRDALASELLLVPHHGSRTSSGAAFLDAVAPRLAVVQAAYRSRFGHPAPDVLARYAERGIAVQRSDRCGAFTLQAGGEPRCEREAARRYWHHRPQP